MHVVISCWQLFANGSLNSRFQVLYFAMHALSQSILLLAPNTGPAAEAAISNAPARTILTIVFIFVDLHTCLDPRNPVPAPQQAAPPRDQRRRRSTDVITSICLVTRLASLGIVLGF